jgi:RsmE family RNA methyltransferase
VLGGVRGEGLVKEATRDRVVIQHVFSSPPLERAPIDLIVGVPRPQTVKKVIQAGVMLGVRSIHFVKSELGEKSYLQSKVLSEEGILAEGVKALEQVWDSQLPEIRVHRSFSYFMDVKLPLLGAGRQGVSRLLAHPTGRALLLSDGPLLGSEQVVAIGPERGWSASEVEQFEQRGFTVVGLGARIVRVETAVVLLLGQLQLKESPI